MLSAMCGCLVVLMLMGAAVCALVAVCMGAWLPAIFWALAVLICGKLLEDLG